MKRKLTRLIRERKEPIRLDEFSGTEVVQLIGLRQQGKVEFTPCGVIWTGCSKREFKRILARGKVWI